MKKIIIGIIMFTFSNTLFSQISIDSTTIIQWGRSYYGDFDSTGKYNSIVLWNDGSLEIRGDTIAAIKGLFKTIQVRDSTEVAMYDFQVAAVNFTNAIPDYWKTSKNNCKWNKYNRELKRQGYVITKVKNGKSPCK